MARIKDVFIDTYENRFNGFIVIDEKGNKYKIPAGTLIGFITGREILKTTQSRIYKHITRLGEKSDQ